MATYSFLSVAFAGGLLVAASACAPYTNFSEATPVQPVAEYRIGPEDELFISVWKDETLTRTVPVRPDGKISLPLLHDVQAAGLTPAELRDVLKKKLTAYMPNPEVSVIVQGVKSLKVSVLGEVKRPGVYEIRSRSTVLDALAQAEGLTEFASRSRIVVMRYENGVQKRYPFNYNRAIAVDGENTRLQSGDIIVVP